MSFSVKKELKLGKAKNEDELQVKMAKDALTLPCICCRHETPISKIVFIRGDPVCLECSR